jgi:transcriptional regulator with XRE-family HTH domain
MAAEKRDLRNARRLGAHLRRLREEKGLTAAEVAKQAGFTQQQISQVERGAINTPIETLARIAKALGVSWRECLPENGESSVSSFWLHSAVQLASGRRGFMQLGYDLGYLPPPTDDEKASYPGLEDEELGQEAMPVSTAGVA